MSNHHLRFRQIHLDFHTSPHIPGIGEKFDAKQWQDALKLGHVNSITSFSKCHHGWSYHPTKVGRMHPHLNFDLLRAQFDAAKAIDVNVPIYISAGLDDVMAAEHPEWREVTVEGRYGGWTAPITNAGFHSMCFGSDYMDYLCEQIVEVVRMFPNCDGIFLDIISQGECCCKACLAYMREHDLDPSKAEDRQACARASLERYYRESTAACRCDDPNMPVFHNSGHVTKGDTDILKYFSHLELESLPTGGWGYDHFPLSAHYVDKLGLDYMGMTGKFHTTWGEFGGFKHPNALRYECGLMLANGAKCSIGDQLHPNGRMDETTYKLIGEAYAEVEAKEPWCDGVTNVADIAVLSTEAEGAGAGRNADNGAGRVLLEEHMLFDLIDRRMDFSRYKLLILADAIRIDDELKGLIDRYLAGGGNLLLTGKSGLRKDRDEFAFDIGADYFGESPFQPDYLVKKGDRHLFDDKKVSVTFFDAALVMYMKSQQVKPTTGEVLAGIRNPYFNRTWEHYCSHQHAPDAELSEYAAAVRKGSVLYLAHPIFSIYAAQGAVAYREYAANAIRLMLGDATVESNLPSTARISLKRQAEKNRYVLHLLHANTVLRGGRVHLSPEGYVRDSNPVEVIEDLLPLRDTEVTLRLPETIRSVKLEPQGTELQFTQADGELKLCVGEFTCHQMVVMSA